MKVKLLGSAGWIPSENETSCILVEDEDHTIILDAGTGVSHLKDHTLRHDAVHLILSHYHLDHLIGLIYLVPYLKDKTLHIYGPGKPVYEKSTEELLGDLLQPAFFSRTYDRLAKHVYCHDYHGEDFMIGDKHIVVSLQCHSAPSYSIQIGNLIYATDTLFNKEDWINRHAQLLLHECWEIDHMPVLKHTSFLSLKEGLSCVDIDKVCLIHHNPEWTSKDYEKLEALMKDTKFFLGKDGMSFDIQ